MRDLVCHRGPTQGILADVGCGRGTLYHYLGEHVERYLGIDVLHYNDFPHHANVEFHQANLDAGRSQLPNDVADVVCSLETIEHVENPRAFLREVIRLTKPGGILLVTTPNQLSLLSKACLMLKNQFVHFQERPGLYPAHLSALLEIDLLRMAWENGLTDVEVIYTGVGRIPLTAWHWPRWLNHRSGWRGRAFSDNVLLFARKPRGVR